MKKNILFFILLTTAAFFLGIWLGFNQKQIIAWTVFSTSVWATLLFWNLRVPICFLAVSFLFLTNTLDLEHFIQFSSLEVIMFLMGMMILIAALEEVNFFDFIIMKILSIGKFTAKRFVLSISLLSPLSACLVDEVTSIIFMSAIIINICKKFKVSSIPYIIISVITTNIGSAGTMLGNPIGILIGTKAGLTFEDFFIHSLPLVFVALIISIIVLIFWFRKDIKQLDKNIETALVDREIEKITLVHSNHLGLTALIFFITLLLIALHHRLELLLGLQTNTLIVTIPLLSAGIIMLWHREKAKKYHKENVDWWTLIFFMLLFAKAGTLRYIGISDLFAERILNNVSDKWLLPLILWSSCLGSSMLDNVVLVASYIPIIFSLQDRGVDISKLWWALLFGGCFGGNITMIGSTANIVALGILEEKENYFMPFVRWFGVGLTVGLITTTVAWIGLTIL